MGWVTTRGRPLTMPQDRNPWRGPTVDVNARTAWLLRVTRMALPLGGTGHDFSKRLGTLGIAMDPPAVTRLESNQRPVTAELISAYETLLEVPAGRLLAVCDNMSRTLSYRSIRPARVLPDVALRGELDRISDVIRYGHPTGGDWLSLAHLMTQPNGIVLPRFLEDDWLYRLIDEMVRSAAAEYCTRIEAMSRVMTSDFAAERLVGVGLDRVGEAGAQGACDVIHVWGDGHDDVSVDRAIALLGDPDPQIQRGAALALLQRVIEGRLSSPQVARLVEATRLVAREGPPGSGDNAFMLARRIAPGFGAEIAAATGTRPSRGGQRAEAPAELGQYLSAAREYSGLEEDRMLERLLREALDDDYPERSFQARMMLGASPYAPVIARTAVRLQQESSSAPARRGGAKVLAHLSHHVPPPELQGILSSPDPYLRSQALVALAHGPGIPSDLDLRPHLRDPEVGLKAAYAAGMTRHPDLQVGARDPEVPADVRRAARWWTHRGGRVVDDL